MSHCILFWCLVTRCQLNQAVPNGKTSTESTSTVDEKTKKEMEKQAEKWILDRCFDRLDHNSDEQGNSYSRISSRVVHTC